MRTKSFFVRSGTISWEHMSISGYLGKRDITTAIDELQFMTSGINCSMFKHVCVKEIREDWIQSLTRLWKSLIRSLTRLRKAKLSRAPRLLAPRVELETVEGRRGCWHPGG